MRTMIFNQYLVKKGDSGRTSFDFFENDFDQKCVHSLIFAQISSTTML